MLSILNMDYSHFNELNITIKPSLGMRKIRQMIK